MSYQTEQIKSQSTMDNLQLKVSLLTKCSSKSNRMKADSILECETK